MRILSATVALMLLTSAVAMAQQGTSQFPATLPDPVLSNASAKVKQKLEIPALDNGALVMLAVKKGDVVQEEDPLAQIDDTEAVLAHAIAVAQLQTAQANAGRGSEIQINFAKATSDVARHVFETKRAAALSPSRAITTMEVQEAELEYKKSLAQIDVRQFEQEMAAIEVGAKQAEVEAAQKAVERRHLVAPFSGVVEEVRRREGEWVQAGEPILTLMNFETMEVSANVDARLYSRQDVDKRPVTVLVELTRNEQVELPGIVTVVSQQSDGVNRRFNVTAEVANRKIGNHWVLADGAKVTMTIHVNRE